MSRRYRINLCDIDNLNYVVGHQYVLRVLVIRFQFISKD